jgi:hypothetical protein
MMGNRLSLVVRPLIFLAILLLCAKMSVAQEVHSYVGGAIETFTSRVHSFISGGPDVSYNNTSDDTSVTGIVGEAGVFLKRNVAVGAEFEVPFGRRNVTSSYGYFTPFTRRSQYREQSLFGVFHAYMPMSHRARGGIMAGGGVVSASSLALISNCNFDPKVPCGPFTPEKEVTRFSFNATVGGDIAIAVAHHLSVVSQFRAVWAVRGADPASADIQDLPIVALGVDRVSYRVRLGLRATF